MPGRHVCTHDSGPGMAATLAVQLSRRSGAEVEAQQPLHLGSLTDSGNRRTRSSPSQARPEAENPGHCSVTGAAVLLPATLAVSGSLGGPE